MEAVEFLQTGEVSFPFDIVLNVAAAGADISRHRHALHGERFGHTYAVGQVTVRVVGSADDALTAAFGQVRVFSYHAPGGLRIPYSCICRR